MQLTEKRNTKINRRFDAVKPSTFYAKLKALVTCDGFSPRLNQTQARSLLSQRSAAARRPSMSQFSHDESAFQQAKNQRPDLY